MEFGSGLTRWSNRSHNRVGAICTRCRIDGPACSSAACANAGTVASRHHGLTSLPRTSASSVAPANISTSAQAPCASMWMVEFVKNVITGHNMTPMKNSVPGHRYARQARFRQTSTPTIASASRQRLRITNPVPKSQWTCSAGGCIACLLEVLEQPRHDDQLEQQADEDHEQRGLDAETRDALPTR